MDQQPTVMKYENDAAAIDGLAACYNKLTGEIGKVIVGQQDVVKYVLLSVLCTAVSVL